MSVPLFSAANTELPASVNLNMASMTLSSAAVVYTPQYAAQSLTTMPAPTESLPLLTVPAHIGT